MADTAQATRPVLSIGEVLIDLIAHPGSTSLLDATDFSARPGGAPANAAVALARLGVPSAFCGVVGEDPFGTRLCATLDAERVDTSRLRATPDADTTLAFAWKDARGDGHFRLLRMADRLLSEEDVAAAGIERVAALVVGSVALSEETSRSAVTHAVELAATSHVPICFDVNVRPTLWRDPQEMQTVCAPIVERATLLKLSLDDARHLFATGDDPTEALARVCAEAPGIVVLTDGARGCWHNASDSTGIRHIPAFPVAAVEPTGAGDAFTAALISRLIARAWTPPDDADLRVAAAAGALATTKPGAMAALPTATELAAFLSRGGVSRDNAAEE